MTLRLDGDGPTTKVLCDGPDCDAVQPTPETNPVLAWYHAVLQHGWVGSSDDRLAGRGLAGVFCPGCVERLTH